MDPVFGSGVRIRRLTDLPKTNIVRAIPEPGLMLSLHTPPHLLYGVVIVQADGGPPRLHQAVLDSGVEGGLEEGKLGHILLPHQGETADL